MTQSLRFRSTCIYGVRYGLSVYMRIDMWVGVVCIYPFMLDAGPLFYGIK